MAAMAPRPRLPIHDGGNHRLGVLLAMLILVALIGLAVYVAVRLANRRPGHQAPPSGYTPVAAPPTYGRDPALEQARLRYARGELSRDDYLRVIGDLGGEPPPTAAT
jgi:uncharacterized membrane protein